MFKPLSILIAVAVLAACTPQIVRDDRGNITDIVINPRSDERADPTPRAYKSPTVQPITVLQERRWIDYFKAQLRGDPNPSIFQPMGMAAPTLEQIAEYRATAQRELTAERAAKAARKRTAKVAQPPIPAAIPTPEASSATPGMPSQKNLGW